MRWNELAERLRDKIDELAMTGGTLDAWRLVDAELFHALVEAQQEVGTLQAQMIALVKSSRPNWSWFQTHAATRELREVMDDLRVLRMCVQSRVLELEAGEAQPAFA